MKKMISEQTELRNYWLEEAISDKVESMEKSEVMAKRADALEAIRYSFDYDYRHYFDAYGLKPMSEFGMKLFCFVLAEWRDSGKTW